MNKLNELLKTINVKSIVGLTDKRINALCFDSREVGNGDLFVAVKGTSTDGHAFIDKAVSLGAVAVVCEVLPKEKRNDVTYILVDHAAYVLGILASNFYGNPSRKLKLIGVTGTNGKTTVATLLYKLFLSLGYNVGLLSTVQNQINDKVIASTHTTPDPIALNRLLDEMVTERCDYCFMEVSSHAIAQNRIAGLRFVGGAFTNLTHDHLDFHKTFDAYLKAKKSFFDTLEPSAFALTNIDDRNGMVMLQNTKAHKKTFGLRNMADFKAKIIESHFEGMMLHLDGREVWVKLTGGFNAYNLLAVYGIAILLEQDSLKVLTAISKLTGAEGRFDAQVSDEGIYAIIDYAHTPDAVKNALETINDLRKGDENIITVLGCGGDRDKAKRPEMAQVAAKWSDKVIITSDNPRSEDPQQIIRDMEVGVPADKRRNVFSIADRKDAIKAAFHLAQKGDIILIAGKGHEKYQEIKGVKYPFDDKEIIKELFSQQ